MLLCILREDGTVRCSYVEVGLCGWSNQGKRWSYQISKRWGMTREYARDNPSSILLHLKLLININLTFVCLAFIKFHCSFDNRGNQPQECGIILFCICIHMRSYKFTRDCTCKKNLCSWLFTFSIFGLLVTVTMKFLSMISSQK